MAKRKRGQSGGKGDPRRLRIAELVRLLNSTVLGSVATDRSVRAHRQAAGLRVGKDRVDLVLYVAWMAEQWHGLKGGSGRQISPPPPPAGHPDAVRPDSYAAKKERSRAREAAIARSGRDIGELPPVRDPERRAHGLSTLRNFFDTYFPSVFYLPWAECQLQSIEDIQRAIEYVQLYAEAMPRGWGKSARIERAALFAAFKGWSRFAVILGETEVAGAEIVDSIKLELQTNELLLADFPEVCYPIHKLEGITQRARGQLYKGEPTWITWDAKEITLPWIPGSPAMGFFLRCGGLLGRTRGMKHMRPDGEIVRPDLGLLDDCQTDQSAKNPAQVQKRQRVINGSVRRMAGPDKRLALLGSFTIIEPDDLAARITDREQSPEWHGRRYKTVLQFPADDKGRFEEAWWARWQTYWEIRRVELLRDAEICVEANRFYSQHRAAMDAGVVLAWEHKVEPGDVSAVQSAMNWLLADPDSFYAEAQNDPRPAEATASTIDADLLWSKVMPLARGVVPATARLLTAFVDVQLAYLCWMVCAWGDNFAGHVVDYGTWPDQGHYFRRRGAKKTIAREKPGETRAVQLRHALEQVTATLQHRAFPVEREGGSTAEMGIDLQLIDVGDDTDIIVQFIRELKNPRVMPSMGDGLKPSDTPIPERRAKEGQQLGHHWMIHVPTKRAIRYVFHDTNRWKDVVYQGLAADRGAPNSITICADTRDHHRVLLDHLLAEYPEPTEARGRKLNMWTCRPGRENELSDGLVGCAAAASVRGIVAMGHQPTAPKSGKRRRASGSWAKRSRR